MLKQVTNRRYSKSSRILLIVLMILAIIAVLILTMSRSPKKPVETKEPLGFTRCPIFGLLDLAVKN